MIVLAGVVVCSLIALIASDLIRSKSLKRLVYQLGEERAKVLKKVDFVSSRIDDLAHHIEGKKEAVEKREAKKPVTTSTSLEAVLMEQPYTKLSVASGRRYIVASKKASGQITLEEFLTEEISISKEFRKPVVETTAQRMLMSALEAFARYSPIEEGLKTIELAREEPSRGM